MIAFGGQVFPLNQNPPYATAMGFWFSSILVNSGGYLMRGKRLVIILYISVKFEYTYFDNLLFQVKIQYYVENGDFQHNFRLIFKIYRLKILSELPTIMGFFR